MQNVFYWDPVRVRSALCLRAEIFAIIKKNEADGSSRPPYFTGIKNALKNILPRWKL